MNFVHGFPFYKQQLSMSRPKGSKNNVTTERLYWDLLLFVD